MVEMLWNYHTRENAIYRQKKTQREKSMERNVKGKYDWIREILYVENYFIKT